MTIGRGKAVAEYVHGRGKRWSVPLGVAGLKLWVRAESLWELGEGAAVGRWRDESGNGMDLAQAAAGSRPTLRKLVDGAAAVEFDGADDVLATAGNVLATDRHTILVVAKARSSEENDLVGSGGTGAGDLLLMAGFGTKMRGHTWRGGTLNVASGTTGIHGGAFAIFEQDVDGTKLTVRLNGSDEGAVLLAGAASGASKPIYLGSRLAMSFFKGYVRELLVYGDMSGGEKERVRNYLIRRHGIMVPYPAPSAPGAPADLTGDSSGGLYLAWDAAGVAFELGYKVEAKLAGAPDSDFVEIGETGPGEAEFFGDPVPGANVTYRVRAYNAAGYSGYSNTVTLSF